MLVDRRPLAAVDSTGRRNRLMESFDRCIKVQSLARTLIESPLNLHTLDYLIVAGGVLNRLESQKPRSAHAPPTSTPDPTDRSDKLELFTVAPCGDGYRPWVQFNTQRWLISDAPWTPKGNE